MPVEGVVDEPGGGVMELESLLVAIFCALPSSYRWTRDMDNFFTELASTVTSGLFLQCC